MRLYPYQLVNTPEGVGRYICTIFDTPLRARVLVDGKKRVYFKHELTTLKRPKRSKQSVYDQLLSELNARDEALAEAIEEVAFWRLAAQGDGQA